MTSRKLAVVFIVFAIGLGINGLYNIAHGTSSGGNEQRTPPHVITVQEGSLKRMTVNRYVYGTGLIEPAPATAQAPAAAAAIAAAVTGIVTKVNVIAGQHVRRGELLALMNSTTLTERYAAQEVVRLKHLYAQHNTSWKRLHEAEIQLALLRVRTPISGTVVRIDVQPGTGVTPTTVLASVVDLRRLVVRMDIPDSQAGELKPGQRVRIFGARPVTGRLSYISPTVDPRDGAVMAWASLPQKSGLRLGQYVRLRIVTATYPRSLVAPQESVISDLTGHGALSIIRGHEAVRVPVKTGLHEHGWIEVAGPGLSAGMPVVTVGAYGLPARVPIRIEPAK